MILAVEAFQRKYTLHFQLEFLLDVVVKEKLKNKHLEPQRGNMYTQSQVDKDDCDHDDDWRKMVAWQCC